MKTKPPVYQVRISPELAAQVESLRKSYEVVLSKSAFVELLVKRGIVATNKPYTLMPNEVVPGTREGMVRK